MGSNALARGEGQTGAFKVNTSASEVKECDFQPGITHSKHDV